MDFDFTDEQLAIRETAERFARQRLGPGYAGREAAGAFDRALMEELGALGLLGAELPEALGGAGLDCVTAGLIDEALCAADPNVGYLLSLVALAGAILGRHAAPELARAVVPEVCAGRQVIALALTEPGRGSDAANLQLRADRVAGGYRLTGEKTSITMATQADQVILFARTGAPGSRAGGVSAFLVPLDQPGIARGTISDVGSASLGRGTLFFDGVMVAEHQRLGDEGQGFRQVMAGFDYSRALFALQALGPAAASLAETWAYVTERTAFGKPIGAFQGVTEPLAEAETWLAAARLLAYRTLWLRDRGRPHTAEAAMCKWWGPKVAFDVLHRCILTFGHYGYTRDLPHQQRLREVLGMEIADGTEAVQKMVIARERIGRIAVPY